METVSRPRYEEIAKCKKCDRIDNHPVRYVTDGLKFSGEPVDERLVRTCRWCGYEWEEAVRG